MGLPLNYFDSHTTTDVKQDMLPGGKTGNGIPHDKFNICGIAHAYKKRRQHFHAKTTRANLYMYNGVGARDL